MARRTAKCKGCGKDLLPEERFKYKSKNYCKSCYNKFSIQENEYKVLIDCVCNYFEIDKPSGLILKQIKDYKKSFGYKYAAMTYTLWYCKEIVSMEFKEKYGVYMVKNYYDEAAEFYDHQEKLKIKIQNLSNEDMNKTKIVNKSAMDSSKVNCSLVDFKSLLGGEEL